MAGNILKIPGYLRIKHDLKSVERGLNKALDGKPGNVDYRELLVIAREGGKIVKELSETHPTRTGKAQKDLSELEFGFSTIQKSIEQRRPELVSAPWGKHLHGQDHQIKQKSRDLAGFDSPA